MDIIKMAFKNLFRNSRRSILTSLSLLVAGFVVVLLHSYVTGFLKGIKKTVINLTTGHVLIAKKEYFSRKFFIPQEEYIENVGEIEKKLKENEHVSFYIERLKSGGMIFKGDVNKPVMIMGIDPEKEIKNLELDRKLISGVYDLENGAIIGKEIAKILKVKPGDTVIILSQSVFGGLSGIKIEIKGVATIGFSEFDKRAVILSISNMRKLLKMPEGVHEILVFLKNENKIKNFIKTFSAGENVVARDYLQELGPFAFYFKFVSNLYYFIYFLIVLLATFTIINTMIVAVFERLREIGTLKAIGMKDREVFLLFGIEGTMLGTFGGIIGSLLGWLISWIIHAKGINYESIVKGMNVPIPYIIRTEPSFYVVLFSICLIVIVSFLVSTIPGIYAKRLTPQETLRQV